MKPFTIAEPLRYVPVLNSTEIPREFEQAVRRYWDQKINCNVCYFLVDLEEYRLVKKDNALEEVYGDSPELFQFFHWLCELTDHKNIYIHYWW